MTPETAIREAIKVLNSYTWCQGMDPPGTGKLDGPAANPAGDAGNIPTPQAHARDASNKMTRLFKGGSDRAEMNPDAVKFTAYAAIVKVLQTNAVTEPTLMWDTLESMAKQQVSNVHPGLKRGRDPALVVYNESVGRTKPQVLAFLGAVADKLKTTQSSGGGPSGQQVLAMQEMAVSPDVIPPVTVEEEPAMARMKEDEPMPESRKLAREVREKAAKAVKTKAKSLVAEAKEKVKVKARGRQAKRSAKRRAEGKL